MKFNTLRISQVTLQTKDAVEVSFEIPESLQADYRFEAGQHVSLDFFLERNKYRRTYSICSAPYENKLSICIKRQHLGIISNYINDAFFKGLKVDVSLPFGTFFNDEQIKKGQSVFLWAGGSGITPMLSIAKHLLHNSSNATINLIYANKDSQSIIFNNEIRDLEKQYEKNFKVYHVLSNPKENSFFEKILCKNVDPIAHTTGFINDKFMNSIYTKNAAHYICGPKGMMDVCQKILNELGTDKNDVNVEHFAGSSTLNDSNKNAKLTVTLSGKESELAVQSYNLLEAMLQHKIEPPYACKSGTCGTCKATLVSGEVIMARDFALNEADKANNKILCCQSWAKTNDVKILF